VAEEARIGRMTEKEKKEKELLKNGNSFFAPFSPRNYHSQLSFII
jgi:hypothetical protein